MLKAILGQLASLLSHIATRVSMRTLALIALVLAAGTLYLVNQLTANAGGPDAQAMADEPAPDNLLNNAINFPRTIGGSTFESSPFTDIQSILDNASGLMAVLAGDLPGGAPRGGLAAIGNNFARYGLQQDNVYPALVTTFALGPNGSRSPGSPNLYAAPRYIGFGIGLGAQGANGRQYQPTPPAPTPFPFSDRPTFLPWEPPASVPIPEPATLSFLALAIPTLLRRR